MATITRADPSPLFPNKLRVTLDGALNMLSWLDGSEFKLSNPDWVAAHSDTPEQSAFGDEVTGQFPAIVPGSSDLQFEVAFGQQGPNLGSVAYAWNLDETSGDVCSGTGGDLTALGAVPTDGVEIIDGAWQKARRFSGDTGEVLQGAATPGGFGLSGECSVAAIIYLEGSRTDPATIISMQGDPGNVANGDDNEQFRVQVETDGRITWAWEHGTRSAETGTTDKQLTNLRACLVTVVRRAGVSDYDVDVYVNGDLWQTWTAVPGPDGGTSADMRIGIGRQAVDTVNPFKGMIDQPQVISGALSQSTLMQGVKASILPLPINVPLDVTVQGWKDLGNLPATLGFLRMTLHAVDYASHATLSSDASSFESIRTPDGSANPYVAPPPAPAQPPSTMQQAFSAAQTADFGLDVLVFPGLDETFTLVSDGRVLAEALARRLSTPRGSLPFHPDYGLDLRAYLNEEITADVLYRMKAAVELECEQDERVQSATAAITYDQSTKAMSVRIATFTREGPYSLVLSVSQVSVDLLSQE